MFAYYYKSLSLPLPIYLWVVLHFRLNRIASTSEWLDRQLGSNMWQLDSKTKKVPLLFLIKVSNK